MAGRYAQPGVARAGDPPVLSFVQSYRCETERRGSIAHPAPPSRRIGSAIGPSFGAGLVGLSIERWAISLSLRAQFRAPNFGAHVSR